MGWETNVDLIQKLYIAFYGRPADPGGLRYWASVLPDNASADSDVVRELIYFFVNSEEAQSRFGNPDLNATIDRIYNFAFHRDATDADRAKYAGKTVVDVLVDVVSVSYGVDYATLNNKLEYAKWFTNYLDPNGDGIPNDDATGTKFAATFYGNRDANDIASKLNFVDAANPATKSQVLNDVKSIADPGDEIITNPPESGKTFVLTNGADAFTGTGGDDIFVATETTLSSADVIDGGGGNDLFRYASSGMGPINEAGFEIKNVETVQITSDAVNGTTFDFTGTQGVQTIRNFNSSQDTTLTGLKTLAPTIELDSLGAQDRFTSIVDTTIVYDVAATKGTDDAVQINVSGNLNTDGSSVGTVTANGIEIFNVKSTGSASAFDALASNTLREMNITGDADLTLAGAVFTNTAAVNIVNAKDFTGNLDITLTNSGAANIDVAVTGGAGDDRADFSAGFDKNDAFDGGEGNDTLALTNGVAVVVNAADFGTVKNVEILEITNGGQDVGANKLDLDNFPGVTTVYYSANLAGATTVQDVASGITIKVNNPSGQNLTTTLKTDGASDVLNLQIEKLATAGETANVITAANFETVNIDVRDDAKVVGVGSLTINQLAINNATQLNITGDAHLNINNDGDPTTPALTTLNAANLTGNLTLTGVDFAKAGATITLGSGDDTFNVATADGADTITLGAGKDRIVYTAVAQSDRDMDTITDFVSGTDVVDVRPLMGGIGVASSVQFVGNRPTFAQAQGALSGATADAVFQQDEQILWVDVDKNGTLDNNDFRVKLQGVTSLTAADLGFTKGVTFTANVAGFNTANAADSVENNAVGPEDDVINATVAQINAVGTTIDGKGGADVLNISGAGVANLRAATGTLDNVETITLAAATTGIQIEAADLKAGGGDISKIVGVTGTVQTVDVSGAADFTQTTLTNIEILTGDDDVTIDENELASLTTINMAAGKTLTLKVNDNGVFNFSNVTLAFAAGTNKLAIKGAATVTLDAADLNTVLDAAADQITGDATLGVINTLNFNDTVNLSIATVTDIDKVTIGGANQTLTVGNGQFGSANFTTVTGNGTSNLTIVGDTAGADVIDLDTNNTKISGFDLIDVSAFDDAGDTVKLDANSVSAADPVVWVGDANTEFEFTEDFNASNWTVTAGDFAKINLAADVDLTVSEKFLSTSITQVLGDPAGTETFTVNLSAGNTNADLSNITTVTNLDKITVNGSAGNNTITLGDTDTVRAITTIDISQGGQDTIVIDNAGVAANGNNQVTIAGFQAGAGGDILTLKIAGTAAATFQEVTAAGAAVTAAPNGVIEIHANVGQAVDFTATANGGAIETLIANALGAAAAGSYNVIIYGTGGAGIYQATFAAAADLAVTDVTALELIGVLQGVAADSLTSANFA